ncbi:Uncharacterised protein [Serratia quinivorans]|nr:Uncharacterised protein [Serratia quinivorans]CAI2160416.1 Uncharacterised protein [Serratia quinivorans]CAI2539324.1 Uncharacterised protein [Serratia quinivorans]
MQCCHSPRLHFSALHLVCLHGDKLRFQVGSGFHCLRQLCLQRSHAVRLRFIGLCLASLYSRQLGFQVSVVFCACGETSQHYFSLRPLLHIFLYVVLQSRDLTYQFAVTGNLLRQRRLRGSEFLCQHTNSPLRGDLLRPVGDRLFQYHVQSCLQGGDCTLQYPTLSVLSDSLRL